jgi:diguanylate cyclase (GGDEF)-like protein/PAS domain S-box-containing protein
MDNKKRYKVLVVEDDRVDRMAFKRLVEEEGLPYDYTFASSVSEARESFMEGKYDIVITDYSILDGTAMDILDMTRSTPVVITTGTGTEEIAVKAMKAGAYDYLIKDIEGNYLKVLPLTIENTINRSRAEREFNLLSQALKDINESVFITDREDRIIFVNEAFVNIYGYSREEIIGVKCNILGEVSRDGEFYHKKKDGTEFPVSLTKSYLKNVEGLEGYIVRVARDITERKMMEDQLRIMSVTDELTGLLNRRGFFTLAEQQTKLANRTKTELLLFFIDFDNLKMINDMYGHHSGDWALIDTAKALKETFRESDIIARIGGDEFVVITIGTPAGNSIDNISFQLVMLIREDHTTYL